MLNVVVEASGVRGFSGLKGFWCKRYVVQKPLGRKTNLNNVFCFSGLKGFWCKVFQFQWIQQLA